MTNDYMQCARPRGAPSIGAVVIVRSTFNDQCLHGTVTDWLATQFVIELPDGSSRVVGTAEDFKTVANDGDTK